MELPSKSEQIVREHTVIAAGAGLIPVPLVDLVAVTVVQADMVRSLCRLYGQEFSHQKVKAWVVSLTGSFAARAAADVVKVIPGVGSVVGGVSLAVASGASTYAIGRVVIRHFEKGGTTADFDPKASREAYEEEKARGREVVVEMKDKEAAAKEKIAELEKLKGEGMMTDKEFGKIQARILAGI